MKPGFCVLGSDQCRNELFNMICGLNVTSSHTTKITKWPLILVIPLVGSPKPRTKSKNSPTHTGLARYEFYFKFWDIGGVLICGPAFSQNCRWRFIWFWPILTAHVLLLISYLPNERSTCKQNKKICAIYIKCDKMAWPRTCYQNFQSRQHIH